MLGLLISTAYAQAATTAAAPSRPGFGEMLFPFAAIMIVFYFFQSRPQQKKMKEHVSFLTNMKRGDQVVTSSGILGEVTGITDTVVTLQVADNVRIKVLKSQILSTAAKEGST